MINKVKETLYSSQEIWRDREIKNHRHNHNLNLNIWIPNIPWCNIDLKIIFQRLQWLQIQIRLRVFFVTVSVSVRHSDWHLALVLYQSIDQSITFSAARKKYCSYLMLEISIDLSEREGCNCIPQAQAGRQVLFEWMNLFSCWWCSSTVCRMIVIFMSEVRMKKKSQIFEFELLGRSVTNGNVLLPYIQSC